MNNPQRYLITSALPYANGPLHIGHIAGAYLPADIYVRYLRMRKRDVVFVCGSDEHGVAITIQAKKEGVTPQQIIDKYHAINKQAFYDLGISFDIYHRTSSALHHKTSSDFFLELYQKGVFEENVSEQYYDAKFNQFLADRYITGTCPKCGNPNAYGDQCERCGTSLSADDLINPVSALSGEKPEKKKTKHWYLPLNKYQDWLYRWIVDGEGRTEEWKRNVLGQCKSWLDDGLHPRPITRDLDWGVKVPLPDADNKVLYVWLDAPIGYISATKQWALDNKKDWELYWKDAGTKLVHFIGKDNIVFHCLIFPVILKSHGGYILPANVPANEFMNLEGDKMSTSRNWAVQLHTFLHENPGKQDVLRYVLSSNLPEAKDSEFTWKDYQAKNNNELVAILGNFINRVLVLTHKFFEGKIPPHDDALLQSEYIKNYFSLVQTLAGSQYPNAIESYRFRDALAAWMDVVRAGNKLLTDFEPWKIFKEAPEKCGGVLRICLESMIDIAILSEPFLPFTARKILDVLHFDSAHLSFEFAKSRLIENNSIGEAIHFFTKVDDEEITQKMQALEKNKVEKPMHTESEVKLMNTKQPVNYDDFEKLDLRSGTIIQADLIPKADKLLKLVVDLGFEKRTIVSGIAQHYTPESIIGRKVVVLINLLPRIMRGVESNGMILMAEDATGKLFFVGSVDSSDNGMVIS